VHSRSNRRPERSPRSETRPTHSILTVNNLHYTILYDSETLRNIVYVFYCDCNCRQSHRFLLKLYSTIL
jgi:hypothetical protein